VFFSNSRYLKVKNYTVQDSAGRPVTVKRARPFAQRSGDFRYQVKQGDRLDLLANRFYRDPRMWWLISDANPDLLYPDDLLEPGTYLIIPPAGGN
jgi:nucleoid-associated protein YgaU